MKTLHAQHHHGAPLIFSVSVKDMGDASMLEGELIIRAPGVVSSMTPISRMDFEYDGYNVGFHDDETGEYYGHAYRMVEDLLYKSELEHEANRKEIRLAAGLMELACNPRRCFRLADRIDCDHKFTPVVLSEFDRCVATASIALACTDQEYVQRTFEFYEPERLCPHVEPGDDPCSSCIEHMIDPRGVIQ